MCGIVGAVAERDVVPILLAGLQRLAYRGYDSAGLAVAGQAGLERRRVEGKVDNLATLLKQRPLRGQTGIAHTRWATHGVPSKSNAHPHWSSADIALVHNGIIENHDSLRNDLISKGYVFTSDTDTEVIVHLIHYYHQQSPDLLTAVQTSLQDLEGAYALAIISTDAPDRLIAARQGSPLVLGLGIGEHFIASDASALLPVTQRFIYLEEGDVVDMQRQTMQIYDKTGQAVDRTVHTSELQADAVERGEYRHYMLKEIFEQPSALAATLEGRLQGQAVLKDLLGAGSAALLSQIKAVQIVACGTSYYAGLVASYWLESLARIPCHVEVASEFRYREPLASKDTLLITISQSGETADTLAALSYAKTLGFNHSLSICNVAESALVRTSDWALMTHAGPEIGVASTKAFTTQLLVLLLLAVSIGRLQKQLTAAQETDIVQALRQLPHDSSRMLKHHKPVAQLAQIFADKQNALFLGRGVHYPIAKEGALKLKEISYIHAEAYPAGELKHGPLALIDADMPVVAVAPNDHLQAKLKSNLQEVQARGGQLLIFTDHKASMPNSDYVTIIELGKVNNITSPILYTLPLQLLAYEAALIKGTDVDQPRNLAKAVTVE